MGHDEQRLDRAPGYLVLLRGAIRRACAAAGADQMVDIAIDQGGRIVGGGRAGIGVNDDFTVGRFNANGTLDASFGSDGIAVTPMGPGSDLIFGLALVGDAKLVTSGECDEGATGIDVCVARCKVGEGDQ